MTNGLLAVIIELLEIFAIGMVIGIIFGDSIDNLGGKVFKIKNLGHNENLPH
ncbi:MAG: hypothetical protein UX26_C0029G0008 [Parcubacteria group bacterium GW2011_GWC1_45_9]|nr:MAG: hypothetical protein UW89_C0022G0004 [Parcubacteria group bacterium GW2011_GWB1_45_10]KKU16261.1 MAG: hypothetical protein UX26_C0029G0008 [Parcubacteria group bacterium GW2011_GWC1_45_9]